MDAGLWVGVPEAGLVWLTACKKRVVRGESDHVHAWRMYA